MLYQYIHRISRRWGWPQDVSWWWCQRRWLRLLGFIGLTLRNYEFCMCILDTSIIPTTYIYIHHIHSSSYIVILYWYPDHPGCWYWYTENLPTCFFKNSQSWIAWEVETRCRTTARSAMPSTTPFITASNELGLRHELGINGRSPASNRLEVLVTYHISGHICWGYSRKFRPEK